MKNAGILSTVVLGFFALMAGIIALNGVMLSYLWQWFVVPLGVRAIGVPQAIGLSVLVATLTYQDTGSKGGEAEDGLNKMLIRLVAKVIAFGIAFGVSFMVPA